MKKYFLLIIVMILCMPSLYAQTMMPLPNHSSVYSGSARGYWFTAPCNFTIVGLRVPLQAGTGAQYIHVMKCNTPLPVAFTAQSTNFTTLTYVNGAPSNVVQTVNIPVSTGDVIGILGTAGTGNSYATGGFNTTINGFPIKLTRFGYQGNINTGPAPSYWGEALNNTGSISRVEMYYTVGPPCPVASGLNATNILSTSATVGWNPVAGSVGYDYIIDQNATYTSGTTTNTTATSATEYGLTPSTTYYLHVRNNCTGGGLSQWTDYSFQTLPPCNDPTGFNTTNLTANTATLNWDPLASALSWDYIVDQSPNDPSSSTGASNVTVPTDNITGLTENTWYYVHIRANCTGEQSNWSLDSFLTPIPCRAPTIQIAHINVDEAVAYWPAVPTAWQYEYAVTSSATAPPTGTKFDQLSVHMSALNDGKEYFIHAKSYCASLGVNSESGWSSASFDTFPTGLAGADNDGFRISTYPNPVANAVTIEVRGVAGNTQAALTDVSGKVIRPLSLNGVKTTLDMSSLPKGIYMLKYADDKHNEVLKINKL